MLADTPRIAARLVVDSDPFAIRQGLEDLSQTILLGDLKPHDRGTVEIVLAEVLNNIAEHAYANAPGSIEVEIQLTDSHLLCRFVDTGLPMPNSTPPAGVLPPLDGEDLPEGGFGWHLIRSLSRDLVYCRDGEKNLLTLRLDTEQSG